MNKFAWDRTGLSRKAAMGGADGQLYIYDVAEALVAPRDGEWVELQKTISSLQTKA